MTMLTPFARPLYVMPKPVGSLCNLACAYCYYLEKSHLYETEAAQRRFLMSDETLEAFIRQYIEAQTQPQVLFTWHGGEPLMRPISFYRKVLQLQRRYAGGRLIDNCLQTNGTLLTDEWCSFFREHNWLIGISIDGPQEFHDEYRRARGGQPSFHKVMRGIELLKKHGVEWNAMGVVNDFNADYPLDIYHFYKEIGWSWGAGIRLDLNFFVFRVDFGVKLYDPGRIGLDNKCWRTATNGLNWKDDCAVHFAIGYPF